MVLPEGLAIAISANSVSKIEVFCDDSVKEQAAKQFSDEFSVAWDEAQETVYNEYESAKDSFERWPAPAKTQLEEYGFSIILGSLDIRYCYGDYYDIDHGTGALKKVLNSLLNNFSDLRYEGYIVFMLSDVYGGSPFQWEVSSDKKTDTSEKTYDFIGEKLASILEVEVNNEESAFWDDMMYAIESNYNEAENIILALYAYKFWVNKEVLDIAVNHVIELSVEERQEELRNMVKMVETGKYKKRRKK